MSNQRQFIANTGAAQLSSANPNLDGTGAIETVLTAGSDGGFLKTVIIKALYDTSRGMIRLFIKRGDISFLIHESPVPDTKRTGRDVTYHNTIYLNYDLQAGDILQASTEISEYFNVICEALDWTYGTTTENPLTKYIANTGVGTASAANANTDGSDPVELIYTAGSSSGLMGSEIKSILIKAKEATTPGMVRLYIEVGEVLYLFCEVAVPFFINSGSSYSFNYSVITSGSMALQSGLRIFASTENSEGFNIFIEGDDWSYPS